jgi:type II secretory pathway component PulF
VLYFCIVAPLGLLLIVFGRLKIVPVVRKMFQEFGLETPPWLVWSEAWLDAISGVWWMIALAGIAFLWWLLATRRGRHLRQALLSRLYGPLRELRSADVLQHLGIAVTAGRPIPGALSTLARYHFDPAIRRELLFVRNEVEQGADIWQSLKTAGLLTAPEAHLLRISEGAGNRPWVLRQLVAVKRRRTMRSLDRASELVLPALVFLMAGLVLFQALTILDPLRRLTEAFL